MFGVLRESYRWQLSFPFPALARRRDRSQTEARVSVRAATAEDVDGVAALVAAQARRGNLLPRSRAAIAASLDDWLVAVDGAGEVVGCVSLLAYPSGLVEVRSLAVADRCQGNGVGSQLMAALIAAARRRGVATLFALTRAVSFFQRIGFTVTARENFPEKVWRDCRLCPIRHRCDETAVVLDLGERGG